MTARFLQGGRAPRSLLEGSFVCRCTFHPALRGQGEEKENASPPLITAANDDGGSSPLGPPPTAQHFLCSGSSDSPESSRPPRQGVRAGGALSLPRPRRHRWFAGLFLSETAGTVAVLLIVVPDCGSVGGT